MNGEACLIIGGIGMLAEATARRARRYAPTGGRRWMTSAEVSAGAAMMDGHLRIAGELLRVGR